MSESAFGELIEANSNLVQAGCEHLAAVGLEKAGLDKLGVLISPVIWLHKYDTTGETPTAVDVGLWGIGTVSTFSAGAVTLALTGIAGTLTGAVKALVDDDLARKVKHAQLDEPKEARAGVFAIVGSATPSINAADMAAKGCTVWLHPNGVWVGIRDAAGQLVVNYKPKRAVSVLRPNLPLQRTPAGGFLCGYSRT